MNFAKSAPHLLRNIPTLLLTLFLAACGGSGTDSKSSVGASSKITTSSISNVSSSSKPSSLVSSSLPISSALTISSSSTSSTLTSSSAINTTPNPLIFDSVLSASQNTEYASNKVTITGINTDIAISIKNGEYSINNSAFTKTNGSAVNGDTIQLKIVTSNISGEPQYVTLNAGNIIAKWAVTNAGTFNLGYTRDLIDSFSSLDGWSVTPGSTAGSQTLLTQQGPNGETVIRLVVDKASGKRGISKTMIPKDYSKGWFGQWVRFPDLNLSRQLVDSFWRDPFSSNGYYQRVWTPNSNTKVDETTVESGDWEFIMWQGNEMAASGKQSDGVTPTPPFDVNTVWFNKLYVQNIAIGDNAAIDFGPWYANIRQDKAKLLITFDDSNETDYTEAFAYLKPLGIKATTYTITNLIGSNPGFLTIAELQEMQAAGWTIGSHHELNLAKLTPDKLLASLTETKEWMIANGFTSWPHFSFPEGAFNPSVIAQMKALGYQSGRTVIVRSYPLIPENSLFHLGGDGTSRWKTAAEGMADIDAAIASGGTIFLFTHRLDPTIGSLQHTNIDIWKAVVNYAIAKRDAGQLDILTMDELYDIAIKQPGRQN
jgi:peptidoglycan/xylan/chitin deacetylase (PgdA/CDA1 family)